MKRCNKCGSVADDRSAFCPRCGNTLDAEPGYQQGYPQGPQQGYQQPYNQYNPGYNRQGYDNNNAFDAAGPEGKCRGVAALLAIFLGGLGIQYFYVGKITAGILCIVLTIVTCGIWEIVTLIQGIVMLASQTNAQFEEKYVRSTSTFPLF